MFFPAGTYLDPESDDDGDVIPLLLEYAWALDPTTREDRSEFLTVEVDRLSDQTKLTFPRDPRTDDLTLVLEATGNLVDWDPLVTIVASAAPTGTGLTGTGPNPIDASLERVTATDIVAPSAGGPRFIRLRAFRP